MSIETNWWSSLRHGGLLLSTAKVLELFPDPAPALAPHIVDRLRGDILRLTESPEDGPAAKALLDTVLHDVAGLGDSDKANWQRGNDVQPRFTRRAASGEMVKPRRVWCGPNGGLLPVFVDDEPRLGIGRGRRSVSRVIEWCRGTGYPLALLTNGHQFRLLHVATEHDAWCEWDTALWFEAGQLSAQVEAWQRLLAPALHTPAQPDTASPLLDAIRRSRQGQSQLSSILGERVRQAVEVLIHAHTPYLTRQSNLEKSEIYRAGTLVVMRLVVALFAEARDLFPRSNRIYETSYGLQGLWEKLARAAGGNHSRLRQRHGAWPQVLALFRLIHDGSPHGDLSLRAYGGELFKPAVANDPEGVRRAMHLFETACYSGDPSVMSDGEVYQLLELLTRCAMPVRQGRTVTTVTVPVDFADLSTEYIGILYEGLLDYELHQVASTSDDPVLFINLGDQPALPLSRLEGLVGNSLKTFFKEFNKKGSRVASDGEEQSDEDDDTENGEEADPVVEEADADLATGNGGLLVSESAPDPVSSARQRALAWARRAVVEAQLVKAYTGADPGRRAESEEKITRAANQLVLRTILPGDFFLVRWGGTRKGQGSFYTRPGLVAPTVQRTLAPLCYELPGEPSLEELRDPAKPRSPAAILALKVCDPATGSASFPVSALRYLAAALWRSLLHHQWLLADETAGTFRPGPGLPDGEPEWFRECVRDLPSDFAAAEGTIRARLKRLIVERCLYGVDLDPLAIELARLSLWIETMDRDLPFGFLDHKFKCGNGLVGCWFDHFQDYPALCLHRPGDDAGDKAHTTAVHCEKGRLTDALKLYRDETLKPSLVQWIDSQDPGVFAFLKTGQTAAALQLAATQRMEELHALPLHETEARAALYHEQVEPALAPLRTAFDVWCALWFWPVDEITHLPLPGNFTAPSAEALAIVSRLRAQLRFFHWELEFPDVFTGPEAGFHAILGNPPWETLQPVSKEWFSNHDPLYRTYGKQEALRRQKELFTLDARTERAWVNYCAEFKALSNWCAHAAFPWADPSDEAAGGSKWSLAPKRAAVELHRTWRARRALHRNFSDRAHAFRHQGEGKPQTYKLFLEQMLALMRPAGRLGVIVPSNVYTDKGTATLRAHFLDRCRWEWIFGIENREKIFDIHRSFKFCPIIVQKGDVTVSIRTAFMRRSLSDWAEAENYALPYAREQVTRFSPKSLAILELRSQRDAAILDKMYRRCVLLGDDSPQGWGLKYRQGDFNMTSDSKLFPPRPVWEQQGYQPDEYGHWLKGDWQPVPTGAAWVTGDAAWLRESWRRARSIVHRPGGLILSRDGRLCVKAEEIEGVALPLYEGRMIDHFDFSAKGWVSGKGRGSVWRDIPWDGKVIEPQFLLASSDCSFISKLGRTKVGQMRITSATNARTVISTVIEEMPCGDKVATLNSSGVGRHLVLSSILNSFSFDWQARTRVGGVQVDQHILWAMPAPRVEAISGLDWWAFNAARRGLCYYQFARSWMELSEQTRGEHLPYLEGITAHERLRLSCIMEALSGRAMGVDADDFKFLVAGCDYPANSVNSDEFSRTLDPKGFWRVDKELDPELRLTVLAQVAFQDLQQVGLDTFLAQNDGEGWMLPETLRLSDYGLGQDDRARNSQPVASRLGPRFHPWQREGTAQESWEECRRHAALIQAIRSYGAPASAVNESSDSYGASPIDLLGQPVETDLFGNEVSVGKRKKGK